MEATPETSTSAPAPTEAFLDDLERRVQALEESVAGLHDTQALEERIVARVADRLPQSKARADADGQMLAEGVTVRPPPAPPPVEPSVRADAWDRDSPSVFSRWGGRWTSWLFVDMWREGRTLITLLCDARYVMAWSTRLVVLLFLPLILTSHWWLSILLCGFPWVEGLRGVFVAAVNLVLAFALYKALSREVRRYNEFTRR